MTDQVQTRIVTPGEVPWIARDVNTNELLTVQNFAWIRFPNFKEEYLPKKGSEDASGYDLHAAIEEPVTIVSGAHKVIGCGVGIVMPTPRQTPGWIFEAQCRSRSGLAAKHGIHVLNSPGTVDNDYRGELMVTLKNGSFNDYTVMPGDRIAQLIPVVIPNLPPGLGGALMVDHELYKNTTARGDGGLGSTGLGLKVKATGKVTDPQT